MRGFDLSPLFRSTIGFDRMGRLLESAMTADEATGGYPPYNIEKTGDETYRIIMAVAGFSQSELDVIQKESSLIVTGRHAEEADTRQYLHRGIASRAFERRFQLADHIHVAGASLENGLLYIDLLREIPEAAKPRVIQIGNTNPSGSTQVVTH